MKASPASPASPAPVIVEKAPDAGSPPVRPKPAETVPVGKPDPAKPAVHAPDMPPEFAATATIPASLLFRRTAIDAHYNRLGWTSLGSLTQQSVTELQCERVYFAGGRGLCLYADRGFFTTYNALVFGPDFEVVRSVPLAGSPTRARVSPDGRWAASTVFVSGHSYASAKFSTQTLILDVKAGTTLGDLEEFTISRNGQPFREPDFNFWGVTFANESGRFYCTLGTGGKTYLMRGSVDTRRLEVVREGVECPLPLARQPQTGVQKTTGRTANPLAAASDGRSYLGGRAACRTAQCRRSGGVARQRNRALLAA